MDAKELGAEMSQDTEHTVGGAERQDDGGWWASPPDRHVVEAAGVAGAADTQPAVAAQPVDPPAPVPSHRPVEQPRAEEQHDDEPDQVPDRPTRSATSLPAGRVAAGLAVLALAGVGVSTWWGMDTHHELSALRSQVVAARQEADAARSLVVSAQSNADRAAADAQQARADASLARKQAVRAFSFAGEGRFLVGQDIEPGLYVAGARPGCSVDRLSSVNPVRVIGTQHGDGSVYLAVWPGDVAVQVHSCATFHQEG